MPVFRTAPGRGPLVDFSFHHFLFDTSEESSLEFTLEVGVDPVVDERVDHKVGQVQGLAEGAQYVERGTAHQRKGVTHVHYDVRGHQGRIRDGHRQQSRGQLHVPMRFDVLVSRARSAMELIE